MIANKTIGKTSVLVTSIALFVCAVKVVGYTYTWTGASSTYWDDENWTRTGCGTPCTEWPDDPTDKAIIGTSVNIEEINETVDDLTIADADVRIGKSTSGYCDHAWALTVDTVTVIASAGQSAKFRGGACGNVATN